MCVVHGKQVGLSENRVPTFHPIVGHISWLHGHVVGSRPGKHTKNDGNWPIEIVDLPIINGDFP